MDNARPTRAAVTVVRRPSTLRHPLHPDQFVVDERRRALVRRIDHQKASTLGSSIGRRLNDIRAWIDTWNDNPRPYVRVETADHILDSVAHYCGQINDSKN